LLRWEDPDLGLIPPAQFISVAEETGLIQNIGEWVLYETCRQGRIWLDQQLPNINLAVNLSPLQLHHGDVQALIGSILQNTGFPAHHLELELTESALMEQQEEAVRILQGLRQQGIRIAIDDFGTGYSSLAYLKQFPLDVLKIDKRFVDDIPHERDDMEIAAAIVAMGHSLRLTVLAEGVETEAQLAFLQQQGCDYYQGYLRSHPLPAEEFAQLLIAQNKPVAKAPKRIRRVKASEQTA
jgi:EAL domain-containing protein (putative c-di-GMP-specific phosphodiesterase class I)